VITRARSSALSTATGSATTGRGQRWEVGEDRSDVGFGRRGRGMFGERGGVGCKRESTKLGERRWR
jgi:hypothetical protein